MPKTTSTHTNSASAKTRKAIREEFARQLYRYKDIRKISVINLAQAAGVSRSTFYTHYNSVEDVAADIKQETLRVFLTPQKIESYSDADKVIDGIYKYLKKNERLLKLLFRLPEATDFALQLGASGRDRIIELMRQEPSVSDTHLLDLEIATLTDGLALQCVRYFRGETPFTLENIMECSQLAAHNIMARRSRKK